MTKHLQHCIDKINEHFPDDRKWLTTIINSVKTSNTTSETYLDSFSSQFKSTLKSFLDIFYNHLNQSLLEGEFISFVEAKSKVDQLLDLTQTIKSTDIQTPLKEDLNFPPEESGTFQDDFIKFLGLIEEDLKEIQSLSNDYQRKVEIKKTRKLFDVLIREPLSPISQNNKSYDDISPGLSEITNILRINKELAIYELNLASGEEMLSDLQITRAYLEKVKETDNIQNLKLLIDVLLSKSIFLTKKILYRLEKDKQSYLFAINQEEKQLEIDKLDIKHFALQDKYCRQHYKRIYDLGEHRENKVEQLISQFNPTAIHDLRDFHLIISSLKDDKADFDDLSKILDKFEDQYKKNKESISEFDNYAYKISWNYLRNCRLSLIMSQQLNSKEFDTDKVKIEIESIRELQKETGIKNYFPFLKYGEYLTKYIDFRFSIQGDDINLPALEVKLVELELVVKILKENFEWCVNRKFLPYQLTFAECISTEVKDEKGEGESIPIFLFSSFVLPLDYYDIWNKVKILEQEKERLKTVLKLHESISHHKDAVENINSKLESYDRRAIEILGLFTAIVLFTTGSIQLFTKVDNFKSAAWFLIIFAISLLLFVFGVWFITADVKKRVDRYKMTAFIIFLSLLLLLLISFLIDTFIPSFSGIAVKIFYL